MAANITAHADTFHPAKMSRSLYAETALAARGREVRDQRLSGDRNLPLRHQRLNAVGEIDIDPRPEADHADPSARTHRLAHAHEAEDAPRNQSGNLHHADTFTRARDHERIAFIVIAGFVEIGVQKQPFMINDALNAA